MNPHTTDSEEATMPPEASLPAHAGARTIVTSDGARRARKTKHDIRLSLRVPGALMKQVRDYGVGRGRYGRLNDSEAIREMLSENFEKHSRQVAKASRMDPVDLTAYREELIQVRVELGKLTRQVQAEGNTLWQIWSAIRQRKYKTSLELFAFLEERRRDIDAVYYAIKALEAELSRLDV